MNNEQWATNNKKKETPNKKLRTINKKLQETRNEKHDAIRLTDEWIATQGTMLTLAVARIKSGTG